MAKKNFYAVRVGKRPGIYRTWGEAQPLVAGYPGAKYKGFATKAEAEAFMAGHSVAPAKKTQAPHAGYAVVAENAQIDAHIAKLQPDEAIAFTDGSYDKVRDQYAYGVVMITTAGKLHLFEALPADPRDNTHQVIGEVAAVEHAVLWAEAHGKKTLWIYADYLGVHEWGHGSWHANAAVAKEYQQFIRDHDQSLAIHFVKVHSHDTAHPIALNDEVDMLVKQALGLR